MALVTRWFGFGRNADFDAGIRAFEAGSFEEAVEALRRCLEQRCEPALRKTAEEYWVQAHSRLAFAFAISGRFDVAASHLSEAVAVRPDYADLRFRLAWAYFSMNEPAKAESSLNEALALNPNYADAALLRSMIHVQSENWDAALASAESPEVASRFRELAEHEALLKAIQARDAEEARNWLDNALEGSSQGESFHVTVAEGYAKEGRFDQAAAHYEIALRAVGHYPDLHCKYAQVLLELDRLGQALDHLDTAVRLNPRYAEAHAQRGITLRRLGRGDDAREAFREALKFDPHHVIAELEVLRP